MEETMGIADPYETTAELFARLRTDESGLSDSEAASRLVRYGPNRLPEGVVDGPVRMFLRQFRSPLIFLLVVAGVIVFSTGETTDGIIILAVLLFNALVGTVQEGRAQGTLLALRRHSETNASVFRDGREVIVSDTELVPGDVILLREGEKVPADARVTVSRSLKVDEASFTGESEPVNKVSPETAADAEPTRYALLKGSYVVAGSGSAVVTATGTTTVIGGIAEKIATIGSDMPLQREIARLSRVIVIAVILIGIALFATGLHTGRSVGEMFGIVVALSVSIVPEGLPIVVTLVLAAGVYRMSRRSVLVKKLQAVEALGSAEVIAVDKTGTITKNELVVLEAFLPGLASSAAGTAFRISGNGYAAQGGVFLSEHPVDPANHPDLEVLGKAAALCADARVAFSEEDGLYRVSGDPTEAAMSVFAGKLGFHRDRLLSEGSLVAEMPFDYSLKLRAVSYREGPKTSLYVSGAPEVVLDRCERVRTAFGYRLLGKRERNRIDAEIVRMSREGLRVVALADRKIHAGPFVSEDISDLAFIGVLGLRDDLRPEVARAMEKAAEAGIRVVMITGDYRVTAETIARDAGIFREGDEVLTGTDLDLLSDPELAARLDAVTVFARVSPVHKLRIIEAYRSRGEIVAMTGDGVNDAPSLVAADLGVAMGKTGTEVAKEAADIVLLDDDFGNIVLAVEEGRGIYQSIRRVVLYLFSTSLGEVLSIASAMLLGMPLPVTPGQIVWLNLVTDGFLDISLGMEPKERGLLRDAHARGRRGHRIVDASSAFRMTLMGSVMAFGTLLLFGYYLETYPAKAGTVAFTTLAVFQWMNALNCRRESLSVFRTNLFSNRPLLGAFAVIISLQVFALYHPFMGRLLHTIPLSVHDWCRIVLVSLSIIVAEEIRKLAVSRFGPDD